MKFATDSLNQVLAGRITPMARKRGGLLAQIEGDVLDDTVPLSSVLQKCVVLGGQAGSEKMRDWALGELNGYAEAETVPDYRHVPVALMALITNSAGYNGMTQRFNDSVFPRQIREIIREKVDLEDGILSQGIGDLESLASQGREEHRLLPPWSSFIADTLNKYNMAPNSRVAEVYWSVPNASIRGTLVRVRTALAELITLTPQDDDVSDKVVADQAVQFVITGDRPTIHYGNSPAGGIVTHSSGDQYTFGHITGNVAVGSSNVTQNYSADFDITKVRQFAALATEIVGLLGLDAGQQAELTTATDQLHEAINDPADKGRMRRAVDSVMSYLKLAGDTALRTAAIAAGNQAGSELDLAIRHMPH
jgi:hypothetical protein